MRYRDRDRFFEGLSEKDAARLRAFLESVEATPGLEGLKPQETKPSVTDDQPAKKPNKRGHRE